jgi:hypothetical protein
VGHPKH